MNTFYKNGIKFCYRSQTGGDLRRAKPVTLSTLYPRPFTFLLSDPTRPSSPF